MSIAEEKINAWARQHAFDPHLAQCPELKAEITVEGWSTDGCPTCGPEHEQIMNLELSCPHKKKGKNARGYYEEKEMDRHYGRTTDVTDIIKDILAFTP